MGLEGKALIARPNPKIGKKDKERSRKTEVPSERVGENPLPVGKFHPSIAAATAEDTFFGTDGSVSLSGDFTSEASGLGRGDRGEKLGWCDGKVTLGGILSWLNSRVDDFLDRRCKTLPTGRLFPLPSSPYLLDQLFPKTPPVVRSVLRCVVWSLNSLNGEGTKGPEQASEYQVRVLGGLLDDCSRVAGWSWDGPPLQWKDFFRVKGVDYKGEEVLTAQTMRWANVAPALPLEVGSVPLEDVVELGSRHYVLNFEEYLLDPRDQVAVRPPRVLVPPEDWPTFCRNLLDLGVFSKVHEDDIYQVKGRPLLNGLFGVSKHEYQGTVEILRIIMNLIPLNRVVRSFDGDISTLPSWAGMSPLHLQPHEQLLLSSEDVRAFFYIFRVPNSWHRFLAFNRELPPELCGEKKGRWFPCSSVLPMGFKNSVSIAQHVHRFIVKQALHQVPQGSEAELRKDRCFTVSNPMRRIYLDNYDELEKVSKSTARMIAGTVSPLTESLQHAYANLGVPRHPKKGVARQLVAEVQGAIVDGEQGLAYPKVEKVLKYAQLAKLLLEEGRCTQKQVQVVGGGMVYISMFRRPLLGGLNHIWQFILSFEGYPPVIKLPIPLWM